VAAKLTSTNGGTGCHLAGLLNHYLGIEILKTEQQSDWTSEILSASQVDYAANDVRFLDSLLSAIMSDLRVNGRLGLALRCFDHIPTRVELDVLGVDDPFTY